MKKPYDGVRTTANFRQVSTVLAELQDKKDKVYGGSWQKYGEKSSIFPNLARKFDRLENIIVNEADAGDESMVDTIADLATYALLWMTYIMHNQPEKYEEWCESHGLDPKILSCAGDDND